VLGALKVMVDPVSMLVQPGDLVGRALVAALQPLEHVPGAGATRHQLQAHGAGLIPGVVQPRVGLNNVGNTCYLNSCLQALFLDDTFLRALFQEFAPLLERRRPTQPSRKPMPNREFGRALALQFCRLAFSCRTTLDPTQFVAQTKFGLCRQQQDATELLRWLLEQIGKVDDPSSIVRSVYGCRLQSEMSCDTCAFTQHGEEWTSDLGLSLPTAVSQPVLGGNATCITNNPPQSEQPEQNNRAENEEWNNLNNDRILPMSPDRSIYPPAGPPEGGLCPGGLWIDPRVASRAARPCAPPASKSSSGCSSPPSA